MVDMKMATPRLADDRGVKDVGSASRCLFDIYLKDGQEFMGQQEYKKAMSSYNKALEIKSRDSTALIARSWCYLKMGKRYAALRDAETVLESDVTNPEALHAKAEVLFQSGNFELSLIYFHRGLKQHPKRKAFLDGVEKSQEAVLKFGGSNRGVRMSTAGDLSLFMRRKHSKKGNWDPEKSARADVAPPISDRTHDRAWKPAPDDFRSTFYRPLARITKKPGLSHFRSVTNHSERCSSEISHMTGTQPTDGAALKQILGQLYTDKKYLQTLYQSVDMSMVNKGSISDLAEGGINFLQERGTYWDKLGPLPPPQPNRRFYKRKPGSTSEVPSSVYSFTTNPTSGTVFTGRADALSSVTDVNFSFMSHEPDEESSVAMETDSHGAGASINLFLASEASVTSMGGRTREATTREKSHYFAQELEAIEKLFTQGRFTDCSDRAEACLTKVEAATEREITQKWDIIATLHSYIGNAAACRGKYLKAEFHHAKDLEIGELEDIPEVSSRALGNLGRMYCSQRKYNKALDVLARKAPLCTIPREVAWVFLDIGTCFMALGYHDYARDCGKKVLSVTRHSDLQDELFQAQLLVASSEQKMKKYEKASRSFSTALDTAITRGDKMAEYAIRNEMKKIEKKLAFQKSRQRQEVTSPRQHIPTDKKDITSYLAQSVDRQFENTSATNQDNNQTETLAYTNMTHAAVDVAGLPRPTGTLAELDGYVYKEFDGVTILSVLQKLREESNTSSTHTISEYQESEVEKLDDIASDLDQIDSPQVKRRPSMKKRASFVRQRSKSHLQRRISFKLWDEKDNLFEHNEEGLKSTERDGSSTGRTLSNRERAVLTIREKTSRIRYQKMDKDWTPRDIDLAKYSRDELENPQKLDGNVVATALAESGYLDFIKMVGSEFDIGGGVPNTDVDNYTPEPEKKGELQANGINDDSKIIPSGKTATDSALDNITSQPQKLDEYCEVHATLFEEDFRECETLQPIFLYPEESESFSCPFDSEFVADEEDVMVVSTSGIIQEDHEAEVTMPRRLSVVFEGATKKFKKQSDQNSRFEADSKDMTPPYEADPTLNVHEMNKPELNPAVAATDNKPGVPAKRVEVASTPKNTPRSRTSKVSNRNRQVQFNTSSDIKQLSTPRSTKSILKESKSTTVVPNQAPTNRGSKETPRGHVSNRTLNLAKGETSTEKKGNQPGVSASGLPRHRSQLKSDPRRVKHKVTDQKTNDLQQEQRLETGTRKLTSTKKKTLYKSKFHDSLARKPEPRKVPVKYGRGLVLPSVQRTRKAKALGNSKLESETSTVVHKEVQDNKSEDKEGEDTVDADDADKPVALSFVQKLKSFLGILSLRKPQPLPKIQEAGKDNDPEGKLEPSNTDTDDRNIDIKKDGMSRSAGGEMKDDEEMVHQDSEENQGASEMRTTKNKLLPVLKDSPYTKLVRSQRTKAKLQMITVKPKSRRPGVRSWKGSSFPSTQSNRNINRTNVAKSSPRNQSVTESGGAASSNTVQRADDFRPNNGEESRDSVIQRSEIPQFIKKRNLLYKLSNKDGQILFTPVESTEPKNKWKVVYMRVRKGERQFTVPVIQEPSETETGSSATLGTSAETLGTSAEKVKLPQKLYPMRKQSKKQFRKRMVTDLGNVPEEWDFGVPPKPRTSPRNAKPVTIPIRDDTDRYKATKIDIKYLATIFETKDVFGKRLSVSGGTISSDKGVTLRVPRGQEVVYRQTDREGNIVLVPVVKTPAHKIVLVKVKRKDQTFVLPVIVDKT